MTVSLPEAQRDLPALLDRVARGEEVIITREGGGGARLVVQENGDDGDAAAKRGSGGESPGEKPPRQLGLDAGKGWIADDFDAPIELVQSPAPEDPALPKRPREWGLDAGKIRMADDFDDPIPWLEEYFS